MSSLSPVNIISLGLGATAFMSASLGGVTSQLQSLAHTRKESDLRDDIKAIWAELRNGSQADTAPTSLVYLGNATDAITDEFDCKDGGNCTVSADDIDNLLAKGFRWVTVVPSGTADMGSQ